MATRGWEGSTTNHIAERAGVSIGSLYKYFPNKPSILAEVARRRIDAEVGGIAAVLAAYAGNPHAMPAAMVASTADRYAANAALDTALLAHLGVLEMGRFLRDAEDRVVRMTADYFGRHELAGGETTAFIVVHALRGTLVAAAAHNPALLSSPAFRQELVEVLERHIVPA